MRIRHKHHGNLTTKAIRLDHKHSETGPEGDRLDHQPQAHSLILLRKAPLQVACSPQHSHHSTHAIVIVILWIIIKAGVSAFCLWGEQGSKLDRVIAVLRLLVGTAITGQSHTASKEGRSNYVAHSDKVALLKGAASRALYFDSTYEKKSRGAANTWLDSCSEHSL
eukprot:1149575-Pelagomonas_calceolata.AAC.1